MTEKVAKAKILWYLLYRFGSLAAVTEMRYADVFAISRAGYTQEIEIKVSKSDLMSELKVIDMLLGLDTQKKYMPKFYKHDSYLRKEKTEQILLVERIPNKFSFGVPPSLVKVCSEHIKDTPYGLYKIYNDQNYVEIIRKPDFLHKNKISEEIKNSLLRKVSTEIQSLREQDCYKKRATPT